MTPEYAKGQRIPGTSYRVVRRLGEGGMGVVYEVDDSTLAKRYALKMLLGPWRQSPEALARIVIEARALARIQHPNIVNVTAAGVTADGDFFYAMDLLRGATLASVLFEKGRLELPVALTIALSAARALERVHAAGLVHRDIKPSNIFLAMQPDRSTLVKLLDFGVAGLLDGARGIPGDAGAMVGTPWYASPEQQRGETATPVMDVWSLGAVVFEMATGTEPFAGATLAEAVALVQSERRAPSIVPFVPSAPSRLVSLVSSMLEKDPEHRVASAARVSQELVAILNALRESPNRAARAICAGA